jgi:hypothetical protein
MTEDGPDQTLIDLAQHVGYQFEQTISPVRVDPPFWRKGMLRVFLSHISEHGAFAAEIQQHLLSFGISSFVAHNDIEPSLEWQAQIETALATCDALIALLHNKFHASNWTDQEIGFAMGRGVPTFSIRLGQTPYGFIARFQAFNGKDKGPDEAAQELFDCYRKHKHTQKKMSEVLVTLFEQRFSFAGAKTRVGYLEEIETWDPTFSARIQNAVRDNAQISGSWGVSKRVDNLIARWRKTGI